MILRASDRVPPFFGTRSLLGSAHSGRAYFSENKGELMQTIVHKSVLCMAFGTMLLFGGCATKESVEQAQSSADAAKSSAAQALTAAQSAQAAAQAAQQKADQAEMDAQAAAAKSTEMVHEERAEARHGHHKHHHHHHKKS